MAPVVAWADTTGSDQAPSFAGFSLSAEANGIGAVFGNPASQPYPVAGGQVPETLATLSTGPVGYALASAAWPGPLLSNAGSLAGVLLPLCVPNGQGVCSPKPDPQTLALANYPVRAEASSPAGNEEQTLGPMSARSAGNNAEASVSLADFSSAGVVSAGRVTTASKSFIGNNGLATATADSTVAGLTAAEGAVHIDAVHSYVKATTDGVKLSRGRQLTVEGLTVEGHKATVDESGVHFDNQGGPNPANPAIDGANKALAGFGITMFLTHPRDDTDKGGTIREDSGALAILWQIPGSGGEQVLISLGGVGVVAQATPALEFGLPDLSALPGGSEAESGTTPPNGPTVAPSASVPSAVPGALLGNEALPYTPSAGTHRGGRATRRVPVGLAAHVGFAGTPLALVLLAFAGAILIGAGLRRMQNAALVPAHRGGCPLTRGRGGPGGAGGARGQR